ncbi:MAG: NUDIX domain-containing protein [Gammaproteobacteria bacterium]|nr:NUDIX domain-containing protein [Gammaproteobacteria bacterium]
MSVRDSVTSAVATLIIKNEQILLGRRFENEQFASWQCPGGYLQRGETVEQAARRLCLQKAGLDIQCLSRGPYSNNIFADSHHTVTLYIVAKDYQITNQAVFKDEKVQWSWFAMDALPEPLFLPLQKVFQ